VIDPGIIQPNGEIRMPIPDWAQQILTSFETWPTPFQEVEVAESLARVSKGREKLNRADCIEFVAEWAGFLFGERRRKDGVWKTFFEPCISWKQTDGPDVYSPDLKELDADVVAHWEARAKTCSNAMMRARYADLVWDLKHPITKQAPNFEYAQIAIDSYLAATDSKLYQMDVMGIQWLERALDLSRSINDEARTKRIVAYMFEFYDRIAESKSAGTWLFLFDNLYGEKITTPEQDSQIIEQLEGMLAKMSDITASPDGVYRNLDPWNAEAAGQRLAKHYQRLKDSKNVQRVVTLYGNAFAHMARQASSMMAPIWLEPVIESYEQAGLKDEAEQLESIIREKEKDIPATLKTVSVSVEIKQEDIDKMIEHLMGSGDAKTSLLRIAEYFIPNINDAKKLLERLRTDAPFHSLIPITFIESGGSTTAKVGSIDDDPDGRLNMQLGRTVNFYQPYLEYALVKVHERYALTADAIVDFLCESPLFADSYIPLLRDGISAYEQRDFVKAIHVIVPQLEHILRNFMARLGLATRKRVRGHGGVTDTKGMNDVLQDMRVREVLTENLWRYLTVVYVERKGGMNLRNDLAHGLLRPESFNQHTADRVLHTLLALSLMRDKPKPEPSSE
jgi:hypothetical protein